MEKNLKTALLLDEYGGLLPERQLSCLRCYYEEDLSLSEIAENEGITRQGVRDNIKRGEAFLMQCEEKIGLVERLSLIRTHLDNVSEAIDNIDTDTDKIKKELALIEELL